MGFFATAPPLHGSGPGVGYGAMWAGRETAFSAGPGLGSWLSFKK